MTKIQDELAITETREPVEYATIINKNTFDELIELFGDNHLITALIKEIRKNRKRIIQLEAALFEYVNTENWQEITRKIDESE